jgi:hypothetical protein
MGYSLFVIRYSLFVKASLSVSQSGRKLGATASRRKLGPTASLGATPNR